MVICSLACLSEGCGSVICGYWVIEYIDFNLQLIGYALRLLGIPDACLPAGRGLNIRMLRQIFNPFRIVIKSGIQTTGYTGGYSKLYPGNGVLLQ